MRSHALVRGADLFRLPCGCLSWGGVDTRGLIEKIYPADQMARAFEKACTRGSMKVLIDFTR